MYDVLNDSVLVLVSVPQDMVCTREAPLAGRALGVLEVLLRGQTEYEADLCSRLRSALLQTLQRLSMENMGHGFGQGHTAQGKRHEVTETEYIDLLYHIFFLITVLICLNSVFYN